MFWEVIAITTLISALDVPSRNVELAMLELHAVERAIVKKTNQERAESGLPALAIDPALMRSARRHATWMTRKRSLVHTSDPVAENIAMGQRSSTEALRAWMNSSGHRANILNRRYRRIGVAAYVAANGTIYWCQQFLE